VNQKLNYQNLEESIKYKYLEPSEIDLLDSLKGDKNYKTEEKW